jgi:hypothetical protein
MRQQHASYLGFAYAVFIIVLSFTFTKEKVSFSSLVSSSGSGGVGGGVAGGSLRSSLLDHTSLVGSKNASSVIQARINQVHVSFEQLLKDDNSKTWQILRLVKNSNFTVSVHYPEAEATASATDNVPYIKSSIFIDAHPSAVQKLFTWRHYHDTLSAIDPFYETSEMIAKMSSSVMMIRKVG